MTALLVTADGTARRDGDVDAVIASLPVSLAWATDRADVAAVSGTEGWAGRASRAFATGARGVMVVEPIAESTRALVALQATADGRPVVIDRALAGHPGLVDARAAVSTVEEGALLEVRLVVPETSAPAVALLEQLALVRAVGSPLASGRRLQSHARGFSVRGTLADGRPALLSATASTVLPTSARIRLVGARTEVSIEITGGRAARPLRATLTTADGTTQLPTRFETAHRGNWRRLHDAVAADTPPSDLDDLVEDLALAASL